MADRGPHSKECATAESGTCHCDCHGAMHGVAHLKLPKGATPRLHVAKASGGGFKVTNPDTGMPPGGGTKEERIAARVADVKVTATNGPTAASTTPEVTTPAAVGTPAAISSPNADAISAKEAELARARDALAVDPLANVGGDLRTNRHAQQVDASIRRTAAAADKASRLERELAELRGEKPQPVDVTPPAPRGVPVKAAELKPGDMVSGTPGGKPLAVTRVDRLDSGAAMVYHEKDPSDPGDMGFWLVGGSGNAYRHDRAGSVPEDETHPDIADKINKHSFKIADNVKGLPKEARDTAPAGADNIKFGKIENGKLYDADGKLVGTPMHDQGEKAKGWIHVQTTIPGAIGKKITAVWKPGDTPSTGTAGAPGSPSANRLAELAKQQARAAGFPVKPAPFTPGVRPPKPNISASDTGDQRRAKLHEMGLHLVQLDGQLRKEPKPGQNYYADAMRRAVRDADNAHMKLAVADRSPSSAEVADNLSKLDHSVQLAHNLMQARARRAALPRSANPDPARNRGDAVLAIEAAMSGPNLETDERQLLDAAAHAIEGGMPIEQVAGMVRNLAERPRTGATAADASAALRDLHGKLTGAPSPASGTSAAQAIADRVNAGRKITAPLGARGVPVKATELAPGDHARVTGIDQYGKPITLNGYVQSVGGVNIGRGAKKKPGHAVQMSDTKSGQGSNWRGTVYVGQDATVERTNVPDSRTAGHPAARHPGKG